MVSAILKIDRGTGRKSCSVVGSNGPEFEVELALTTVEKILGYIILLKEVVKKCPYYKRYLLAFRYSMLAKGSRLHACYEFLRA